ncbi:Hypothetical protein LLA12_02431 [Lactococcus lactis subsp. lactis]
MIIVL